MNRQLMLLFKILYHLLYFKILLNSRSFSKCLLYCQQKGSIQTENEIQFVDKVLRKILTTLHPASACLLHSLVLSRMTNLQPEIYLEFEKTTTLQSHAFVKWKGKYYSTSHLKNSDTALHLWSKDC